MRLTVLALSLFATSASAQNLTVQFSDGAPKDTITLRNFGCSLDQTIMVIDLRASAGGLLFDVASGGKGVEVFQVVEMTEGDAVVSPIRDGDQLLEIFIKSLPTRARLSLTADLDDTLANSTQTTVTGAEIEGAVVTLALATRVVKGTFDDQGLALITIPDDAGVCLPS